MSSMVGPAAPCDDGGRRAVSVFDSPDNPLSGAAPAYTGFQTYIGRQFHFCARLLHLRVRRAVLRKPCCHLQRGWRTWRRPSPRGIALHPHCSTAIEVGEAFTFKTRVGVGCFFFPSTVAHHTPLAQIETFSNDIPVVEKKKTKFNGQEQVSCVQSIHQGKTKQGKITFSSMQTLVGGHRDVFAV